MAKFVKLHQEGLSLLINLDKVIGIEDMGKGNAILHLVDGDVEVDESFDDVAKTVGAAQGGIPMEPSRMY